MAVSISPDLAKLRSRASSWERALVISTSKRSSTTKRKPDAMAMDLGIPESEALDGFMAIHDRAGLRVAHNISFDDRIMRIALSRYRGKEAADAFKATPGYCTCQSSKNLVQCPPTAKMIAAGFGRQFKQPTVAEALRHFTGEELVGGHRARPDTEACARVYFAMNPPIQVA